MAPNTPIASLRMSQSVVASADFSGSSALLQWFLWPCPHKSHTSWSSAVHYMHWAHSALWRCQTQSAMNFFNNSISSLCNSKIEASQFVVIPHWVKASQQTAISRNMHSRCIAIWVKIVLHCNLPVRNNIKRNTSAVFYQIFSMKLMFQAGTSTCKCVRAFCSDSLELYDYNMPVHVFIQWIFIQ